MPAPCQWTPLDRQAAFASGYSSSHTTLTFLFSVQQMHQEKFINNGKIKNILTLEGIGIPRLASRTTVASNRLCLTSPRVPYNTGVVARVPQLLYSSDDEQCLQVLDPHLEPVTKLDLNGWLVVDSVSLARVVVGASYGRALLHIFFLINKLKIFKLHDVKLM